LAVQLLPLAQLWLQDDELHQASVLMLLTDLLEHGGAEHAKKYTQLALPHLQQALAGDNAAAADKDQRLQAAAAAGLGVVAQYGGKLLSRGAAADAARKLGALVQARDARCADNKGRTESAVLAIGRLLTNRMGHLEAAGIASQLVPLFLSALPLRGADEEQAQAALHCFCTLLGGAAAQAAMNADSALLPQVLTVMGATAGKETTGAELTAQMQQMLRSWKAANPALLQASASALSQPTLDTLGKMMGAGA
jgi:hypothetical protein